MAAERWLTTVALALGALALGGCFDEPPAPGSGQPIFGDAFTDGFSPNPFDTSVVTALAVDGEKAHSGSASIRLDVPGAASGYAGGAVLAAQPQDLTGTNALVFWATASREATFNRLGFGLEFVGPSTWQTTAFDLPLTTEWTRHLIPIPDPAKLGAVKGMLWYAEVEPTGYSAWFDEVKFDRLDPAVIGLQAALTNDTAPLLVGGTERASLTASYTDFDGTVRALDSADAPGSGPAPGYFSFASSNPAVARVDAAGIVTGVSVGQAVITARLAGVQVPGDLTVDVAATLPTSPAVAAPTPPPRAAGDVVSLFTSGGAYAPHPVDTWGTAWSNDGAGPNLSSFAIPGTGSVVKRYTGMKYVGVEFLAPGPPVDASGMTTLHADLWTPDASAFSVKLVSWSGGAATGEAQVDLGSAVIRKYRWVSLEIPLSRFAGVDLASIGQLLWINGSASPATNGTFFVDNVYFHK